MKLIEDQLVQLEDQTRSDSLLSVKRIAYLDTRVDQLDLESPDHSEARASFPRKEITDFEKCMVLASTLARHSLQALSSYYGEIREIRSQKQSMRVSLSTMGLIWNCSMLV